MWSPTTGEFQPHLLLAPLAGPIIALVVGVYLIDGYRVRTDMLSLDYASQHTIALASAFLATLLLTFVFITSNFELQSSRGVIALSFAGIFPITLGYRRLIYERSVAVQGERSFVFLGDHASCLSFPGRVPRKWALASPSFTQ